MFENKSYELYKGDCLEVMDELIEQGIKVDMILCDLPYGTTQNKWDSCIPLNLLWNRYNQLISINTPIVLLAQSPFDKHLAISNINNFKYQWVIEKTKATGHLNSKKMPMKAHELALVFYNKLPIYNPQKTTNHPPTHTFTKYTTDGSNYGATKIGISGGGNTDRYPRDVLKFKWDTQISSLHPTQKPIKLLEYFINTYTNEGMTILDNTMGSGSTGVACINTNRKFIGIELDDKYFDIAKNRIEDAYNQINKIEK